MVTSRVVYVPTILEDGQIQLRRDTIYEEQGVEQFRKHHRQVLEPGEDVSQHVLWIRQLCALIWTPAVIAEYQRLKALRTP